MSLTASSEEYYTITHSPPTGPPEHRHRHGVQPQVRLNANIQNASTHMFPYLWFSYFCISILLHFHCNKWIKAYGPIQMARDSFEMYKMVILSSVQSRYLNILLTNVIIYKIQQKKTLSFLLKMYKLTVKQNEIRSSFILCWSTVIVHIVCYLCIGLSLLL